MNKAYRMKIINASRKNMDFQLSEAEYLDMIKQPCHYCGKPSHFGIKGSRGADKASIDRIDNSIRIYRIDLCVPSCMGCNRKKHRLPYGEFMGLILKYGSVEAIPECYVEGGYNQYMRERYKHNAEHRAKQLAYMREYMRLKRESRIQNA